MEVQSLGPEEESLRIDPDLGILTSVSILTGRVLKVSLSPCIF